MGYHIIDNTRNNHRNEIKHLFSRCSRILIASPFISDEAIDYLKECGLEKFEQVVLITTLKAKNGDQFKKVPVFLKLYSMLQQGSSSCKLSIHVDDRLHGKVYIGQCGDRFVGAIISSANFTGNGIERNHEWGVYVEDEVLVEQVYNQVLNDTVRSVGVQDLEKMKEWFDKHSIKSSFKDNTDLNVLDLVSPQHEPSKKDFVTYWLKPYGTIDEQVPDTMMFDEDPFEMTFARGVQNIKEGDVLVVYAVGSRKILSVYVSTGVWDKKKTFKSPRVERWPYFVVCRNLTTGFGAKWPQESLTLDSLRDSYLRMYPNKEVRPGAKDFRVLQWGQDRIKLDREFTEYVIDEVMKRQ